MEIIPIPLWQANNFVKKYHRHSCPVVGNKFSVGALKDNILIGVGIAGRPVARYLDNGLTLEILRVCTNGTKNANSFIYSSIKKIGLAMGYEKIITYTLEEESGISLKAINARKVAFCRSQEWGHKKRKRKSQEVYKKAKIRWEL